MIEPIDIKYIPVYEETVVLLAEKLNEVIAVLNSPTIYHSVPTYQIDLAKLQEPGEIQMVGGANCNHSFNIVLTSMPPQYKCSKCGITHC